MRTSPAATQRTPAVTSAECPDAGNSQGLNDGHDRRAPARRTRIETVRWIRDGRGEIETIVVRPGEERWFAPENLARLSTLFATPVPPAERHSRAELVAAANAYFTAVETEGTAAFAQAPFAPGMNRIENGLQTTNVTDNPRNDRHRWSAAEQLERAAYAGTVVAERRFPLVDTDRGVTVGIAVFRFAGENGPTLLLAELFKVTGGQLREIRAVVRGIPKGTGAGWPAPL